MNLVDNRIVESSYRVS